ncbi:MAG TPA: DUF2846 domain-containing protein [Anaeromyxobacteraceae bacterium]|nr:DUF2846 domain-containing protein [Anaeromyxobacteraceae bacterium]
MKRSMVIALALLTGCVASGVKHAEMKSSMQALKQDEGRIYFYRTGSIFGAAVQADITLNGAVVGASQPGGFFYVDRPAGKYEAWAATEVSRMVSFTLDPGETKYVRSYVSMGVLVGRVNLELVSAAEAEPELESLHYTGAPPASPPPPAVEPASATPAPPPK